MFISNVRELMNKKKKYLQERLKMQKQLHH